MTVTLIAAVADNGAIGLEGDLPWRLPADLKFFKRTTTGHHLIVGRNTWESVGAVLPGRTMVVVTRDPDFDPGVEGVLVAHSLAEALDLARDDDQPFIGGGAALYAEAFDVVDRMLITRVHGSFEADTFFPEFDRSKWVTVSWDEHEADEKNPVPYTFEVLERAPED